MGVLKQVATVVVILFVIYFWGLSFVADGHDEQVIALLKAIYFSVWAVGMMLDKER